MFADVIALNAFYRTPVGNVARRFIRLRIRELWPGDAQATLVGLGYATPYLRSYLTDSERVLALMPAAQGAAFWPREGPNVVALTDEAALPIPDMSVQRVLVVHGLEFTEQPDEMMREIWRILAPEGRVLMVVPNRRGLWAAADSTPFGFGRPYSEGQLKRLLSDTLFEPERTAHALFIPPLRTRFSLAWAPAWERVGRRWFTAVSGITLVEARKSVFASLRPKPKLQREPRRLLAPMPEAATPRVPGPPTPGARRFTVVGQGHSG